MARTYREVFGVAIGSELSEGRGPTYTPCAAVTALKTLLGAHAFFAGSKLGGTGPLFRKNGSAFSHEFNRHHAGLSVDIMLTPTVPAEVALGHHLVRLFETHHATMKWRSLIYQTYGNHPGGGSTLKGTCWTEGGHEDHVHIDWFLGGAVTRRPDIAEVPLRLKDGTTIVQMSLPQRAQGGLPESIDLPAESGTDFASNAAIASELKDLMARHARGELKSLDLGPSVCAPAPARSADATPWLDHEGSVVHPDAPVGGGGHGFFRAEGAFRTHHTHDALPHPRAPLGSRVTPLDLQRLADALDDEDA